MEDFDIKIGGLQKLSLLDFPDKTACTVFTAGCNFRCPYCHNSELTGAPSADSLLPAEQLFAFLSKRKGLLDGVCVTGGEPLLQKNLTAFLAKIKDMGFAVKLDTNGFFPQKLEKLIDAGLIDYVAMDIKNSYARYGETVGVPAFDTAPVKQSVALLLQNKVNYEFRTTVVKEFHTEVEIAQTAEQIAGAKAYYLQSFVDSENVLFSGLHGYSAQKMAEFQQIAAQYVPAVKLRGI